MYIAGSSVRVCYVVKDQMYSGYNYATMKKETFEKWVEENKNRIESYEVKPV